MITKERNIKKYCCFYVSDFHLEMILLPYIKENMDKSKIIILTQNDLTESVKILLERINIEDKEKKQILNLEWNNNKLNNIEENIQKVSVIINGNENYILNMKENLKKLECKKIDIIDCYNINKVEKIYKIKEKYDNILNTNSIK